MDPVRPRSALSFSSRRMRALYLCHRGVDVVVSVWKVVKLRVVVVVVVVVAVVVVLMVVVVVVVHVCVCVCVCVCGRSRGRGSRGGNVEYWR